MMARRNPAWKLVTPLAYRRPRRPGRRVLLIAGGIALSTVVAGLAVLGSISPTQHALPAPAAARRTSGAPPTTTSLLPTTAVTIPSGTRAFVGYATSRPQTPATTDGYRTPSTTPTTVPPPATTTSDETYTMTYPSGTVVVVYPGGGYPDGGDGGGGGRGGHH
jgi:hypothetical protein